MSIVKINFYRVKNSNLFHAYYAIIFNNLLYLTSWRCRHYAVAFPVNLSKYCFKFYLRNIIYVVAIFDNLSKNMLIVFSYLYFNPLQLL